MVVHVIDHNTVHKALIAKLIAQKISSVDCITFAKTHEAHDNYVANADLVVVSGGTWLVRHNPGTHRRLNDLLIKSGKPVVGICLGAESFASHFGLELTELESRVSGVVSIQLQDGLARGLRQTALAVYEHHRYGITSSSSEIDVLAHSSTGIEAYRHKTLPIAGLQFHPEVRRMNNSGHLVFEQILQSLGVIAS